MQSNSTEQELNQICKLCGDDCSPSLSNRGWCIYCEKAYLIGKTEMFDEIYKKMFATKMNDRLCFEISMDDIAEIRENHCGDK